MKTAIPIVIALAALIALMACNPADEDINKSHDDKQMIMMPMMMPNNQMMYVPLVVGTVKDSEQVSVTPDISEPEVIEVAVEDPEEEEEVIDEETGTEEEHPVLSCTPAEIASEEAHEAPEDDSSDEYWESSSGGVSEESAEFFNEEGNSGVYLGTWTITAYCGCYECCGSWSGSPTASGAWPTEGWTIACGSLPFGSVVYIEGLGTRCVEDRGVYGDWIDVYFDDHYTADSFGMQELEVYLIG